MQAKAEPLREGVVVIKEDTTMEELQELGKRFQERFGVTPVQIAIHKDEGHWQGGSMETEPPCPYSVRLVRPFHREKYQDHIA